MKIHNFSAIMIVNFRGYRGYLRLKTPWRIHSIRNIILNMAELWLRSYSPMIDECNSWQDVHRDLLVSMGFLSLCRYLFV